MGLSVFLINDVSDNELSQRCMTYSLDNKRAADAQELDSEAKSAIRTGTQKQNENNRRQRSKC